MNIRTVTPPAAYPLTLAEAKEYCNLFADDTSQDATLTMLIKAATEYAEHLTGRAFVERTLELNLDGFTGCIELPYAPLLNIESITYTDINGATQTVSASTYEVNTISEPGVVRPVNGEAWPSTGYGFNPVKIQYRAGYRPTGSPTDLTDNSYLPQLLRTWIAQRIATLYDNRNELISGNIANVPRDYADGLLNSLTLGTRIF